MPKPKDISLTKKEKYQHFTDFKRERIIGLQEGGFSYCAIAAHVQRNNSRVITFGSCGSTSTKQLKKLAMDKKR